MSYDPTDYSNAFFNYLAQAHMTGFDWYLTVHEHGTATALELVDEEIKKKENN